MKKLLGMMLLVALLVCALPLGALAEGKNLHDAACFANAVAAISVQRIGTTPSMPTREEVDAFLREH